MSWISESISVNPRFPLKSGNCESNVMFTQGSGRNVTWLNTLDTFDWYVGS